MTAYELRCRIDPGFATRKIVSASQRLGLEQVYLLLSFDCDTPADAPAAVELATDLADREIAVTLAVPGELLLRDASAYKELAMAGVEFVNHGYREHTFYDEHGRYTGGIFYDQLSRSEVAEDIRRGHEAIVEALGAPATGFRTPHFGTFQRNGELRFLHAVLADLEYSFSSSTTPVWALRHGPAFRRLGVLELPVSGRPGAPTEILDSWGCFAAPDRVLDPDDYEVESKRLAEAFRSAPAGVINVYVDPAHVRGRREFHAAVDAWREVAKPCTYREFARQVD